MSQQHGRTVPAEVAEAAMARPGRDDRRVKHAECWYYLESSTSRALAAFAEILIAKNCSFKYAPTPARVVELICRQIDRGSGESSSRCAPNAARAGSLASAEELHQATIGLAGPTAAGQW